MLGAEGEQDARVDLRQVARQAEQLVRQAVADAGQQIDPAAARLVAERAGTDIARLRGDVERLLLYAAGQPRITLDDARQIVSAETAQDDWAVTNAIQRGDAAEALRQLGAGARVGRRVLPDPGTARVVRAGEAADARRRGACRPAIEALFRTDLELKSSAEIPACCSSGWWSSCAGRK